MALALLLASGMALAVNEVGTDGPDTLRGTNGADNLLGADANDDLFGLGGSDNLLGGPGRDNVLGGNERRPFGGDKNLLGGPHNDLVPDGNGSDNLVGGAGNDLVDGGRGSDRVVGERGTYVLIDGPFREASKDTLSGGPGNDLLDVINRPAFKDVVTCGRGFDRVTADRKVAVADDCEEVTVGRTAAEELFESPPPGAEENFEEGLPPFPGE
jgi:Ca2+-binding RTX toxin-like protein